MPTTEELLARAARPAADAMRLHPFYRGKMQTAPKCPIDGLADFAVWYTPGVAAPCRAIAAEPDAVWELTNRANLVAVVTDGTRVLGLGDIGPEAALPVMEGKALLFKYLGGVDAVAICLATKDEDEIVRAVRLVAPGFGGINLEDIAQPKCFRVLERLRAELDIPVWHDDQQGTATVVVAALANALEVVGKRLGDVRIAMIGMGAANVATYRLLVASGVDPGRIVACDRQGILHRGRSDVATRASTLREKWRVCTESNAAGLLGGIAEALRGSDVCIAFSASGPDVIRPEWVASMARDAVVFACANPVPEIWPWEAEEGGARIVCTGRSDFPNQLNNALVFPAIFRGTLDVRARTITDGMALAAAAALARHARERGLRADAVLPPLDDPDVAVRVAVAVAEQAMADGVARVARGRDELVAQATHVIDGARRLATRLCRDGLIAPRPPDLARGDRP